MNVQVDPDLPVILFSCRRVNNHTAQNQKDWLDLAEKVRCHYGEPYRRAVDYLENWPEMSSGMRLSFRKCRGTPCPPRPPARAYPVKISCTRAVEAALAPCSFHSKPSSAETEWTAVSMGFRLPVASAQWLKMSPCSMQMWRGACNMFQF